MLFKYIIKYSTRSKTRTLILILLATLATILVTISAIMYYSSNKYMKEAKSAYTVIAQLDRIDADNYPLRNLDKEGLIRSIGSTQYTIPYDLFKPVLESKYIKQYFHILDGLEGITPYKSVFSTDYNSLEYNNKFVFKIETTGTGFNTNTDSPTITALVIEKLYGGKEFGEIEIIKNEYMELEIGKQYYVSLIYYDIPEEEAFDASMVTEINSLSDEGDIRAEYEDISLYLKNSEYAVIAKYIRNIEAEKSFNMGKYYISEGNELSEEDYEEGNEVCLLSDEYARKNELKIGDTFELSYEWYFNELIRKYSYLSYLSEVSYLPENVNRTYVIKGIYKRTSELYDSSIDNLDPNIIFIPFNGLDKIVEVLGEIYAKPFSEISGGLNETFEFIDGDSIEPFLRDIRAEGIDPELFKFTFYDQGYKYVSDIFKSMASNSLLFLMCAVALMVVINIVIAYIYISKRKKDIAVMRILGSKRFNITRSIITSVFIVTVIGCILGSIISGISYKSFISNSYETEINKLEVFESGQIVNEIPVDEIVDGTVFILIAMVSSGFVLVIMIFVSLIQLHLILRKEPMRLLS